MKYASTHTANDSDKSLLYIAEQLVTQAPSAVNFFTEQAHADISLAQMIEEGLQCGLATQEETRACNQLLGMTNAL